MRTSDLLVEYCNKSQIPKEPSVICDYFEFGNNNNINLILNVYQGLVKYKGITSNTLDKALINNKLNELIHNKYKNIKSNYYNEFCEKKIIVGVNLETSDDEGDCDSEYDNKDDNHCPNCGEKDYLTKNNPNDAPPDCDKCFVFVCKLCSHFSKASRTCLKCYSSIKNTKSKR